MFCPNCGAQLEEGAKFCPACGTQIQQQAPIQETVTTQQAPAQEPVYTQQAAPADEAKESAAKSNMILAIVGCALCCGFYTAIAGFIVSLIAKNKTKAYEAQYGEPTGKAKVAHILAKIGFIAGIVLTVLCIIALIASCAAKCAESALEAELNNQIGSYDWGALFQ